MSFPSRFLLVVGLAAAAPARADGLTGNLALYSEFMFRGLAQSFGPAVQGGADYVHVSGLYAGAWASNARYDGPSQAVRSEFDAYGGWAAELGGVAVDGGLYGYFFPDDTALNTVEAYAGASFAGATATINYTPDYFATGEPGTYLSLAFEHALTESLSLGALVGDSFGPGPQQAYGDDYLDYALTLTKTTADGFDFSLALMGSDLDTALYPDEEPRAVVGVSRSFDW